MNSDRLRHRLCALYASATFSGFREFHASSAARTFWIAVSRVKGGSGGRVSTFSTDCLGLLCCLERVFGDRFAIIRPGGSGLSRCAEAFRLSCRSPALHQEAVALLHDHLGQHDPSASSRGSAVSPPVRDGEESTRPAASQYE